MRRFIEEAWDDYRGSAEGEALLQTDLANTLRLAFFHGALAAITVQTKQIKLAQQFGANPNEALDALAAELTEFRTKQKGGR